MTLQALGVYTKGISGLGKKTLSTLAVLGCDVAWLMTGRESENQTPIVLQVNSKEMLMMELLQQVVQSNKNNAEILKRLKYLEEQIQTNQQKLNNVEQELHDVEEVLGNEEENVVVNTVDGQ